MAAVHSLGLPYLRQQRFDEPEEMYGWALRSTEKTFGRNHESTLDIIQNLEVIYCKQRRLKQSRKMHYRALESYEAVTKRNDGCRKSAAIGWQCEGCVDVPALKTHLSARGRLVGVAKILSEFRT